MEGVIMTQELADKLIAAYETELRCVIDGSAVRHPFNHGVCGCALNLYGVNTSDCSWVKSKISLVGVSYWCDTPNMLIHTQKSFRAAKPAILESMQTRINILKQFKTDMLSWKA